MDFQKGESQMSDFSPKLCGGTFFTLLLEAVRPHSRSKITIKGQDVTFANFRILEALLKIFDPSAFFPNEASQASKYKNCKTRGNTYVRVEDDKITSTFDHKIKTQYFSMLREMKNFTNTYLDIETEAKYNWLARAIIELVTSDDSISNDTPFYLQENGSVLQKSKLTSVFEITLEALLLGIWHFIVMNRHDNSIGEPTIIQWHRLSLETNAQNKFTSDIGNSYMPSLVVNLWKQSKRTETKFVESEIIEPTKESSSTDEKNTTFIDDSNDCEPEITDRDAIRIGNEAIESKSSKVVINGGNNLNIFDGGTGNQYNVSL